jgi:hypothetical protein
VISDGLYVMGEGPGGKAEPEMRLDEPSQMLEDCEAIHADLSVVAW